VQIFQRNTQPVPLRCRQLFELLAALASLAMMSFDQVGGSIDNTSLEEQPHVLISADHATHELQTIATIATSIQCIFRT
jgi:hypothetical protein